MNIAVIGNLIQNRQPVRDVVAEVLYGLDEHVSIHSYSDSEEFLDSFTPGKFDAVFLLSYIEGDGNTDPVTCIQSLDGNCKLFVVSARPARGGDEEPGPMFFHIKPVLEDSLRQTIHSHIDNKRRSNRFVEVVSNRQRKQVRFSDIRYITMERNTVILHTVHGREKIYSSFGAFAPALLEDDRFLLSYYGCIVNMDYIASIEQTAFILDDGTNLMIRKKGASSIKSRYREYTGSLSPV